MGTYAASDNRQFRDRVDAGQRLAALFDRSRLGEAVVLALPRGGVPVGYEVARVLRLPLDVLLVRKLGMPGHEELAMGAIASGGVRVINERVLAFGRVSDEMLDAVTSRERKELERREHAYREGREPVPIVNRHVILVDDGLATGATMRAAVAALRLLGPSRITVAVPVASEEACRMIETVADDVICALVPSPFHAVGEWYVDFSETTDEDVRRLLSENSEDRSHSSSSVTNMRSGAQTDVALVRMTAHSFSNRKDDFEPLAEYAKSSKIVLIGDGSHGTEEFYTERARLTQWLFEEQGFTDVAVEADWPDTWPLTLFLRGEQSPRDVVSAFAEFERFPRWLWRNTAVRDFVAWLRAYNDTLPRAQRAGFFGLDLYSLHRSMEMVIGYLEARDPEAAMRARRRYSCFDAFGKEPQVYGLATAVHGYPSCEEEVVEQLVEMQARAAELIRMNGDRDEDVRFHAVQNARLVRSAEGYYRAMYEGSIASWNLRDRHMSETLAALIEHLERRRGREARFVVWAHNSHLGDARATHMGRFGEINLGQLTRERYGNRALSIGMTTYRGTVAAANEWGQNAERMEVRPALADSYESLFHQTGLSRFMLVLRGDAEVARVLSVPRLERAIGVVYRPLTERQSHYFSCRLADQFDAIIHIDETRAIKPLDPVAGFETSDIPETYPSGL
jgi:erythromycin esterase-like protein/predicted phosphoribosyltransferase